MDFFSGSIHVGNLSLDLGMFLGYAQPLDVPFFIMSKQKGWISLHRTISDHWLYPKNRSFTKYEAWIDILLECNHSEQKVLIKETLITCKRGESIRSMKEWANRWKWSKSKVKRFFDLLQNDSMIEYKSVQITTHLTVCNYDSYQDVRNATETQTKRRRTSNEHQTNTNNNVNNANNVNNVNKVPTLSDVEKYFKESDKIQKNHITLEAENFINHYESLDWKRNGKKIKNWKLQASTWANNYVKFNPVVRNIHENPFD